VTVGATVISFILARRSAAQKQNLEQRQQEYEQYVEAARRYVDQQCGELSGSLQQLRQTVEYLASTTKEARRQHVADTKELWSAVTDINKDCVRHQSSANQEALTAARRDIDRITANLERLNTEMRQYVPTDSYRHDLKLWTNSFTTLRQQIHDLAMLMKGMLDADRA
jgi:chromosome segregation ATPase